MVQWLDLRLFQKIPGSIAQCASLNWSMQYEDRR
jgi:hypothetical protein